jgi:hypothetical protein
MKQGPQIIKKEGSQGPNLKELWGKEKEKRAQHTTQQSIAGPLFFHDFFYLERPNPSCFFCMSAFNFICYFASYNTAQQGLLLHYPLLFFSLSFKIKPFESVGGVSKVTQSATPSLPPHLLFF